MSNTTADRWRARAEEIREEWLNSFESPATAPMLKLGEEMAREAREEAERLERECRSLNESCNHFRDEIAMRRATHEDVMRAAGVDPTTALDGGAEIAFVVAALRARLAAAESAVASARDEAIEECARAAEEVCVGTVRYEHRALFAKVIRSLRAARPAGETDQPVQPAQGSATESPGLEAGPAFDSPARSGSSTAPAVPPAPPSSLLEAAARYHGPLPWADPPVPPPPKADGAGVFEAVAAEFRRDWLRAGFELSNRDEFGAMLCILLRKRFGSALAYVRTMAARPCVTPGKDCGWCDSCEARATLSAPARAEKERGA